MFTRKAPPYVPPEQIKRKWEVIKYVNLGRAYAEPWPASEAEASRIGFARYLVQRGLLSEHLV